MEIKTKFNVGDKLWRILDDNTGVASFVVKGISVYYKKDIVSKKFELDIYYQYSGLFDIVCEENVFETLEQAQAECDRRNNEK